MKKVYCYHIEEEKRKIVIADCNLKKFPKKSRQNLKIIQSSLNSKHRNDSIPNKESKPSPTNHLKKLFSHIKLDLALLIINRIHINIDDSFYLCIDNTDPGKPDRLRLFFFDFSSKKSELDLHF